MIKFIQKYALLLSLTWTGIIFGLCCMPGNYIPSVNWLELLSFDKFVHASLFFGLTCLWLVYSFSRTPQRTTVVFVVVGLCVAYGGLLEIMQATVFSQRSADWLDFIANSFGCLMGLWLFQKKKHILV